RSIEHVGECNESTSEHEPRLPATANGARGVLAGDQGGDHIPGRRLRQEDPTGRRPSPWAEGTLDRSGEAGGVRPVTRQGGVRERERKREQHKGEPGQYGGGTRSLGRDGRQDEDTRSDDSPD